MKRDSFKNSGKLSFIFSFYFYFSALKWITKVIILREYDLVHIPQNTPIRLAKPTSTGI